MNEAIKHNLNGKEIIRRRLRHTINGLNVVQRRQVVTYIFARRDLIEDPKYTTQDSDIEFMKESERDIIEGRKNIKKMEDDLRKLDDSAACRSTTSLPSPQREVMQASSPPLQ